MDAIEQLKQDVREGRIDLDRLVNLVATAQRQLQAAIQRIEELHKQIADLQQQNLELQKQLGATAPAEPAKLEQPFSLRAEEQRQQARGKNKRTKKKKGRRGRVTTAEKIAQATKHEDVFPQGVDHSDCKLSHIRPVWRLDNGRAALIAYHVHRGPHNQYGKIPGVLGRSEFGIEIILEISYLVYVMGLSFDKVCALLQFFQELKLGKSQVDSLLHRLARHWQNEFETLCALLANSAVVHADETSWSLNSVWAFLSEKARLLFFGVNKDGDTLKVILDPQTFTGIVESDDASVYANFTKAQKCWAHLLRKAIKLTLQDPDNAEYRTFTDRLLAIYREACRVQRDGRLGDAGRLRKVAALDDQILELCGGMWLADLPPLADTLEDGYRLLAMEVTRLMLAQELFTFVTAPPVVQPNGESKPVAGTNNEAERTLRGAAQARDTGRTSKTFVGARRQTIVHSVLESLRLYLPAFTLRNVVTEVQRWLEAGRSCFAELLEKLGLTPAESSVLDQVLPNPGG
jgi:transposase